MVENVLMIELKSTTLHKLKATQITLQLNYHDIDEDKLYEYNLADKSIFSTLIKSCFGLQGQHKWLKGGKFNVSPLLQPNILVSCVEISFQIIHSLCGSISMVLSKYKKRTYHFNVK